jgi:Na+(H+)/acetate symporter ActP
MDELEADHLRRQIREMRQSNARWKALALISLCVLALLILAGGATLLIGGLVMDQRRAREAERDARRQAEQARMEAEQARDAEMAARMRAEEAAHQAKETGKAAQSNKR